MMFHASVTIVQISALNVPVIEDVSIYVQWNIKYIIMSLLCSETFHEQLQMSIFRYILVSSSLVLVSMVIVPILMGKKKIKNQNHIYMSLY
jgi:hypothetical protein